MTVTKPTDTAAELRRWARRQVGLGAEWCAERGAVLRRLAEEEFAPPPGPDYAARVLTGAADANPADAGWRQALVDLESDQYAEVEAFAAEFFKLGVEERRRRWHELKGRCTPFPNLMARLAALEPGVSVKAVDLDGPAGELGRMVCELFVLRPGPRGRRRRALLDYLEGERPRWEELAEYVRRRRPDLAALEPVFLGAFLDRWLYQERVRQAKESRATKPPTSLSPAQGDTGWGGGNGWLVGVAVMVVLAIIRAASNPSSPNPPRVPQVPAPQALPNPQIDFGQFRDGIPDDVLKRWEGGDKKNEEFRKVLHDIEQRRLQRQGGKLVPDDRPPPAPPPDRRRE
jgi:hypothetical protein